MKTLFKQVQRTFRHAFTSKIKLVEEYLNTKYVFRYNIIKCRTEIRVNKPGVEMFQYVDKRKLNTLVCELNVNNIEISSNSLKELLESDFSKTVNPIQEYFQKLPKHEGKDHIQELCNTISVVNSKKWNEYFTKWLVAVVANAMTDKGCQNHTCLVLCGKQGDFKTAWLDNLVPKTLTEYLFTGKIDPNSKSSLTYIAEYLFVTLDDQLRQLNINDEHELKNLITIPSVKYRRPYDPWITEHPHLASFMATVNGSDFLNDSTGSRRFLPFEIKSVDINRARSLNMDKVWAQAYSLFKDDFRYFFDDKEIQELHRANCAFQIISQEEQLIKKFFSVPSIRSHATNYYTNAMIQEHIEKHSSAELSPKKIGEALAKLGFEKWQRTVDNQARWVYSVIKQEIPQQ